MREEGRERGREGEGERGRGGERERGRDEREVEKVKRYERLKYI